MQHPPPQPAPEPDGHADPLGPGMRLGRYLVGEELGAGSGGMGRVFAAFDEQLQRHVALKVLRDHSGGPLDLHGELTEEARHLAQLQHPNIVAVHEIVKQAGATCLVMDLVDGTALSDVLARAAAQVHARREPGPRRAELLTACIDRPLPQGRSSLLGEGRWFDAAARIMLEVTRALQAAHGAGVLHRDLKPRNVMLRGDGSPVVLDFGLASGRQPGRGGVDGELRGSAAYLAPEQIAARRLGDDPRSDVYQLGLLLYELLTLRTAFGGPQMQATLARILRGEFARPRSLDRGVPFELEAICLRAMELDPARRYRDAAALAADLECFVHADALPIAARGGPAGSLLRNARYALRRRRVVLVSGLALAAGALAGAILFSDPPPEQLTYWSRTEAGHVNLEPLTVAVGDLLGLTLTHTRDCWVYTLSAFGARDPPSRLAPMTMVPLQRADAALPVAAGKADGQAALPPRDSAAGADGPSDTNWGMHLSPGTHYLVCSRVEQAREEVPFEGLWVFVSDTPRADLEAWMHALRDVQLNTGTAAAADGVAFEHAREVFVQARAARLAPPVLRGGEVDPDSIDELAVLEELDAAQVVGTLEWPYDDPRRYKFASQVAP